MKLRESGMPDEAYWDTLFDVDTILNRLEIGAGMRDVVELGCGYGTFTIPLARRISGLLRTYDIEPLMIERTKERAAAEKVLNIEYHVRDVMAEGFGLQPKTQDACLLFNILHCEHPVDLISEAARVTRPGGEVLVIHWRYDPKTPRGPDLAIRPRPEQIQEWAEATGMLKSKISLIDLPPWHFGLRLERTI